MDDDTGPGTASVIAHMKAIEAAQKRAGELQKQLAADRARLAQIEKQTAGDAKERAEDLLRVRSRVLNAEKELLGVQQEIVSATRTMNREQRAMNTEVHRATLSIKEQTKATKELGAAQRGMPKTAMGSGAALQREISLQRESTRVLRESTTQVKKHTVALRDMWAAASKDMQSPIDFGKHGVKPRNLAIGSAVLGLVSLGRPIESLLGLLAAVPAAAGAASIGIMNFAMLDIGAIKKVSETREKYDKQLKAGLITQEAYTKAVGKAGLTISATEAKGLQFFTRFNDEKEKMKKGIQDDLMPALGQLGLALEKNKQTILGAFQGGAKIQAGGIDDISRYVGGAGGQGDLKAFSRTSKIELAAAVQSANQFMMAIFQLNRIAEPMIASLSGQFAGMFAKFNAWTRSTSGANALADFFEETERSTVKFAHVLKNVGGIMHNIFNAGAVTGNGFLDWLDKGSNRLNKWLASAEGQASMTDAWDDFSYVMRQIRDDLALVLPMLKDLGSFALSAAAAMRDLVKSIPGGSDMAALLLLAKFGLGFKPGKFLFGGTGAAYKAGAGAAAGVGAAVAGTVVGNVASKAMTGIYPSDGTPGGVRAAESARAAAAASAGGAAAGEVAADAARKGAKGGLKAAMSRVATRLGIAGGLAVLGLVAYEISQMDNTTATDRATGDAMGAVRNRANAQFSFAETRKDYKRDLPNLRMQRDMNFLSRRQLGDDIRAQEKFIDSDEFKKLSKREQENLTVGLEIDRSALKALEQEGIEIRAKVRLAEIIGGPKTPGRPSPVDAGAVLPGGVSSLIGAFAGNKPPPEFVSKYGAQPGSQKKFDVANAAAFAEAMRELSAASAGVDQSTSDAAAAAALLADSLGRIPTDIEVQLAIRTNVVRTRKQLDDLEARRLKIGVELHGWQNDLIAIANHRLDIPVTLRVTNPGVLKTGQTRWNDAQQVAVGGQITKPMAIVGEEAPRHPEWVIATNPAYREKNKGHLASAAAAMGGSVTFHKTGGIMFKDLPPAGYSGSVDPVPDYLGLRGALFKEVGGVGELEKLQTQYRIGKEKKRDLQLDIRKAREAASKLPSGPGKKSSAQRIQKMVTKMRLLDNAQSRRNERIQLLKGKDFLGSSPMQDRFAAAMMALDADQAFQLLSDTPAAKAAWTKRQGQELELTGERLAELRLLMGDATFGKRMKKIPTKKRAEIFGTLNTEIGELSSVLPQLKQTIKDGFESAKGGVTSSEDNQNAAILAELRELSRRGLVLEGVSNEQFRLAVQYLQTQGSFAAGTGFVTRTGKYQLHYGEEVRSRSEVNRTVNNYHGASELKITGDGELTRMIADRITPAVEDRLGRNARNAQRIGLR